MTECEGVAADDERRRLGLEDAHDASQALSDRFKELTCLLNVSKITEQPGLSLPTILQGIVELLPPAMQHPEAACAEVTLNGEVFRTARFVETPWQLSDDVRVHGEGVGRLRVGYVAARPPSDEGPFLKEEQHLVEAVAERIGKIAERLRAEEALDNQRRTLDTLLSHIPVGVFVVDAREGRTLLANQRAVQLLGRSVVPTAGVHDLARVYATYLRGTSEPYPEERMPVVRGMQGETTMVEDMEVERPDGTRVPLQVFGGPIRDGAGRVTASVAVFQDITARIVADEQRRLEERRLNSLLEISQRASDLSETDIVQQAVEEAVALTGSAIGYLHFVNPDQESIELKVWSKKALELCSAVPEDHYPLDRAGVWADCVRLGRPVLHNDYQGLPGRKGLPAGHTPLVRHASVPIFDAGKAALVLGVGNKLGEYDEGDVRHLILIGDQLLRILQRKRAENALHDANQRLTEHLAEIERLQAELREQATHDPLTGLLNRRSLAEMVESELERARREHYPIAVVMLDIDHFKAVNDRHGHQAGDDMLRALGGLLQAQARRSDVRCRLGGDEFLVLMPRASSELAAVRAEQWRAAFAALRIPCGEESMQGTLSIGVAVLESGTRDVDGALKEADAALYQSKSEGRNRVTLSRRAGD